MSLGYAQKLSYREDVGSVGMTEIFDPSNVLRKKVVKERSGFPEKTELQAKIEDLAMLIQKSKHLVAFTGAGISTSSGIPDFRGPKGIWTLQEIMDLTVLIPKAYYMRNHHVVTDVNRLKVIDFEVQARKVLPEASLPFHRAMPSLTHMALVELEKTGVLKFVISQNVDNLHLRSGIPREKLAELHGNSFREICSKCGLEYIRDFEVETIGMKETSRRCSAKHCGRKLTDTVLDWEDALPPEEMEPATKHCKMADVVLCLGTSLQITPACNLPMKCLRAGGKMVIVNLQPTPKDKKAALVIHGQVDKVVAGVMDFLNMRIPPYVRIDLVQLVVSRSSKRGKFVNWTIKISSVDGPKAPLPFLKSVEISFPESPDMESVLLFEQPFSLMRESIKSRSLNMLLQLNFADGCGCPFLKIEKALDFQDSLESFTCERGNLLQQLRDESLQDSECGRHVMLQRKFSSNPNSESTTYGVVTSLLTYNEETGLSERNGACMLTKREPPTAVKDEGSEISNLGLDTHEQPQMHDNVQMPESNTRNLSDDKLEIPSGNSHDGISEVNGQDKPILKHQVSEIYKDSKTFKRKRTGLTDNGVQNRASA